MNRRRFLHTILILGAFVWPERACSQMGIVQVIRMAVARVIKAVDLKVQRLQTRTIWLQNAQRALENSMSRLRLREISEWTMKHRDQYRRYYEQLGEVRTAIAQFNRVRNIVKKHSLLLGEFEKAWKMIKSDSSFSVPEIEHMRGVYDGILRESLKNMEDIRLVIQPFRAEMNDAQRMGLIIEASRRVERNLADLMAFNRQNLILRSQRRRESVELQRIEDLYNIKPKK